MRSQKLTLLPFVLLMVVTLSGCATLEGPPPNDGIPICLNEPLRCPDLVPAIVTNKEDLDEGKACTFCRETERDGKRAMEVSVRNQGGIGFHKEPPPGLQSLGNPNAPASVTMVIFTGEGWEYDNGGFAHACACSWFFRGSRTRHLSPGMSQPRLSCDYYG
jgi:hypothetical protein